MFITKNFVPVRIKVILDIESSVRQGYMISLFNIKIYKGNTSVLSNPCVHGIFTLFLIKQIFKKEKKSSGYYPEVERRYDQELPLKTNWQCVETVTQRCSVRKLFPKLLHVLLNSCPITTIVVIGQEFSDMWNSFFEDHFLNVRPTKRNCFSYSQLTVTCSKLTIETLKQDMEYV